MNDRFDWILRAMLSFNLRPLPTKRTRRPVPYADELLARAALRGPLRFRKARRAR